MFFVLAIVCFQVGAGFWARLKDAFASLCAAPLWVQIWVWTGLLPVNMAALYLYAVSSHPLPGWTALGFMFVVVTNMTLVLYERGVSKLTSLPHLIPWIPGQIYAAYWLFYRSDELTLTLTIYAWAYSIVIGISNLFDAYDTWRWFRGERGIITREA